MKFFDRFRGGEREASGSGEPEMIPVDRPQPELMEVPSAEEETPASEPVPMSPEDVDRISREIEQDRNKPELPMVN